MVTQIWGIDVTPKSGMLVQPDGWSWGMPLQTSEWDGSQFRIDSARYTDVSLSVNVKVTGRTLQKGRVRVQIEFVGDGEPSTFHSGWMKV